MTDLAPNEIRTLIQQTFTTLKLLTSEDALAGVILTSSGYDKLQALLREHSVPYSPSGITVDPLMHNTFVVDGMLILRGTE